MLSFANFEKKLNIFKKLKNNKLVQSVFKRASILKQIYKNIIKI